MLASSQNELPALPPTDQTARPAKARRHHGAGSHNWGVGRRSQRNSHLFASRRAVISPYLFFWQAAEEVEDEKEDPTAEPLIEAPLQAPRQLARIELDTLVGMGISNIIALFIMITTAATLNAHGVTDIQTSSQAAEALRPIAGRFRSEERRVGKEC